MADGILSGAVSTPPIITRKQAIALGLSRYFTGELCKQGHLSEKRVPGGGCVQCNNEDAAKRRAARAKPPRALLTDDEKRKRKAESDRRYRAAHPLTMEQKAKVAATGRRWRLGNPDRINELARAHYHRHADKINARAKDWRSRNRMKVAQRFADWAAKNAAHLQAHRRARYLRQRQHSLAIAKAWKTAHAQHVRQYSKQWRKENPAQVRIQQQNRRARENVGGGRLSAGLTSRLLLLQRRTCACCRCDLKKSGFHLDHVQPLAGGGLNTDSNMQLLCPACNRSKYSRDPVEFMQSRGYLL